MASTPEQIVAAKKMAERSNECCHRSDGWEEELADYFASFFSTRDAEIATQAVKPFEDLLGAVTRWKYHKNCTLELKKKHQCDDYEGVLIRTEISLSSPNPVPEVKP